MKYHVLQGWRVGQFTVDFRRAERGKEPHYSTAFPHFVRWQGIVIHFDVLDYIGAMALAKEMEDAFPPIQERSSAKAT